MNTIKLNTIGTPKASGGNSGGGGGGSASGGSDVYYLKSENGTLEDYYAALECADIFHLNGEICPIVTASGLDFKSFKGCASVKGVVVMGINRDEMIEELISQGMFTEITKEQFYTL